MTLQSQAYLQGEYMNPKLFLTSIAVVALASCGGTATSSAIGGSSSDTRRSIDWSNPYADTADEEVTLNVWGGETQDSVDFIRTVAQDFKKANPKSNYTIQVKPVSESSVSGDWAQNPDTAADLAIAADDQIPSMISSNYIQNIEQLEKKIPGLADSIKTRNSKESIEVLTSEEKTYGFPVSASNGYILYYNSNLIKAEDTTSFEKLLAAIKKVSEEKGKNYRFGFPSNSGWYLDGWFRPAGFSVYGEAGKATVECDWNGEATDPSGTKVKGVDVAASLVKLAHGQYEKYWTSQKQELLMNQVDDSAPNQIIATINGTWNYNRLKAAWGTGAAATTLPTYHVDSINKDYGMQSVKGFKVAVINRARAKTVVAACRFAEFLTNYENQILRFDALSEAPTNTDSVKQCDYSTNACVKALNEQWQKGGFVEKVNEAYWNPSNGLSNQLCVGNAGADASFIKSGQGTADIVLDMDAIQAALNACVATLTGK